MSTDPTILLYLEEWLLNEVKQYLVLSFIYLAKKGMNSNTPHNEHILFPDIKMQISLWTILNESGFLLLKSSCTVHGFVQKQYILGSIL